eukprot:SAG11_NODE_955_length_6395_cov_7.590534_2_plen_45_part_00
MGVLYPADLVDPKLIEAPVSILNLVLDRLGRYRYDLGTSMSDLD